MSLTKDILQKLADDRICEAAALLESGHFSGAYYLAGYAVECALKAVIAKNFKADEIPDKRRVLDVYTHELVQLVKYAELGPALEKRQKRDPMFDEHWEFVKIWSEQARYALIEEDKSRNLVDAIRHPESGILLWIKQHW